MNEEKMSLHPLDPATTAILMGICDLAARQVADMQAILELLKQKGYLSSAEVQQALETSRSTAPASALELAELVSGLSRYMMERIAIHRQEYAALIAKSQGPIQ